MEGRVSHKFCEKTIDVIEIWAVSLSFGKAETKEHVGVPRVAVAYGFSRTERAAPSGRALR